MRDQEKIAPIDQYVIDFIRNLRVKKNFTQDDLASILGVGKSFISNVESLNHRAKFNLAHVNAIADYFNMRPGDFLPEKPIPVNKSKDEKIKVTRRKGSKVKSEKKVVKKAAKKSPNK